MISVSCRSTCLTGQQALKDIPAGTILFFEKFIAKSQPLSAIWNMNLSYFLDGGLLFLKQFLPPWH